LIAIYVTLSGDDGLEIYRSSGGTTWSNVTPTGLLANYITSWDMQVFDGHLYLAINDYLPDAHPGAILRTSSGKDWENVFVGTKDSLQGNAADKFGDYNGKFISPLFTRTVRSGAAALETQAAGY
jgi:hypothetical protein